jgi:succinoglycan biosynthesis protein ExoM
MSFDPVTSAYEIVNGVSLESVRNLMNSNIDHISVCVCTFKRADFLKRLLERLEKQRTDGLFTYSAVVSDNDSRESARQVVAAFSESSPLRVTYCNEPRQNIALARNMAVQHAEGNFIAFIDDDEFPAEDWLWNLFNTFAKGGVDGVLGPVMPHFESHPPQWLERGKFFNRPAHASGYRLRWDEARTGNVFFRKDILSALEIPFRPQFGTAGEDMDFFRRLMEKGSVFIWCNEAVAYETVPPSRCRRSYLLRRAMLRGSNFPKHPTDRLKNVAKSLIAVPCYAVALPILALFGEHLFLKYLIKLLDHVSRLLAFLGLRLAVEREA